MYAKFTVEGAKPVAELLQSCLHVENIYAREDWIKDHPQLAAKAGCVQVSAAEMERITGMATPGPVLAVADIPDNHGVAIAPDAALTLLLDHVSDPGNLGTIIRIADWFGLKQIFCSEQTVDAYNPKTVQAAMGSLFRVQVCYTNLAELLRKHRSSHVYAAAMNGHNVYTTALQTPALLLLGNEANGISSELLQEVPHQISIPGSGNAESLNVAVATGILCSEFFRRNRSL